MSIRLDRSFKEDALEIGGNFSTPHFITLLIEKGYVKDDGGLPVGRVPLTVTRAELPLVAAVVNGAARYQHPIVYISKTVWNKDPVDTGKLARGLKGAAHVLVQETRTTNSVLRELCSDQNVFNGAIGIYYPNAAAGSRRYLCRNEEGNDETLYRKVLRDVIRYNSTLNMDALYTWQGVNNALLRDRLCSQRQERIAAEAAQKRAETEVQDVYAAFDAEIHSLEQQVAALQKENEALGVENHGLQTKLAALDATPLLVTGEEDDFFPGEIREIVLSELRRVVKSYGDKKSRRMDVLTDVIESNGGSTLLEERQAKLKTLLKAYDGMTKPLRQELTALGFRISDDGKHHKLVYYGDGRYTVIFAKTPSDHREGKNAAAEIIGQML